MSEYFPLENAYWLSRYLRKPLQPGKFQIDPFSGHSNPFEWIRVSYPSPTGDFNIPYPNPVWSDKSVLYNSARPLKKDMTRLSLGNVADMAFQASRTSGLAGALEPQVWVRDNQAAVDAKHAEWYGEGGLLKPMMDFEEFVLRSPEGFEIDYLWSISSYDNGIGVLERTGMGGNYYRYANILIYILKDTGNITSLFGETQLSLLSAIYGREFTQADVDTKLLALETFMTANNMTFRDESDVNYQIHKYWWVTGDGTSNWQVYVNQYDSEMSPIYAQTVSWIQGDSMDSRNSKWRANRDSYLKCMNELALGAQFGSLIADVFGVNKTVSEQDLADMKDFYLNFDHTANVPNPWNEERCRFLFTPGGTNPVQGAPNTTVYQYLSGSYYELAGYPEGTLPSEALPGVTSFNVLPSVDNTSLLPLTGSAGDLVFVSGEGNEYAWDPINQKWSYEFHQRFIEPFRRREALHRDEKLRMKRDLSYSMRPALFAGWHIPSFVLTSSTDIVK